MICLQMHGFMIDLGGACADAVRGRGGVVVRDELLPEEVRVLPDDLARLDELLCDPELLVPIALRWERELAEASRYSGRGRPSLATAPS